ncbi:MAG TPA: slipin family protein [Anaerolineales bacterium]|nr:slipin family protein [Anaerolineales bacterium]
MKINVSADPFQTRQINNVSLSLFIAFLMGGILAAVTLDKRVSDFVTTSAAVAMFAIGLYLLFAIKIANQWEKVVVLRFGRLRGMRGPGLFWIVPLVDSVSSWIDHRVTVTPFSAEKTLTKDTVPVDVDAVLFWVVWDAEKAALEVKDYQSAISWSAQTALRDIIGKMMLADILVGREAIDQELQKIIDQRTTPWGVTVQSVEIRDIVIPAALEDAMSRQAQAERERQARIILGESEKQIAESFAEASKAYVNNPTALHLRAMNMLFEGLKEKGALVIVPSSAVDTMNLGGLSGMVSLAQSQGAAKGS